MSKENQSLNCDAPIIADSENPAADPAASHAKDDFMEELIGAVCRRLGVPLKIALVGSANYNYSAARIDYENYIEKSFRDLFVLEQE